MGPWIHNLLPQSGWPKITEINSLTVWRPDVRNQGVGRAILSLKVLERSLSCLLQFLVAVGIPWFVAESLLSLPPLLNRTPPLCVSSVSYKDAHRRM